MQKDYKQRKKLHIKKRQGVPYTAFSINASLTLEAALVLPVFLAALVAVVFFLQAIQVQSRLQQSLYNQVKKVSGYAYYMNIADMSEQVEQIMQAEYVKYAVINEIGRDYLENSVITGGIAIGIIVLIYGLITKEGIGYGDGIMFMCLGTVLGASQNLRLLFLSLICATAAGCIYALVLKKGMKTEIPFIPCILCSYIFMTALRVFV